MAGCYKAVAKKTSIKFSESDIETGSGIAKVKVTFSMPDWKKIFEDKSFSGADDLIAAVEKADIIDISLTLRLIDTNEGLKIKNVEDLMDVFEFIGSDIASATEWGGPDETVPETTPAETKPEETEPDETKPAETDPSEPEPSESKQPTKTPQPGSKSDLAAAYASYKKILQKKADDIAWFEKNVSKNSCGLNDFNGDGIPDLFIFSRNDPKDNFISFDVYSYSPDQKVTVNYLSTALTDVTSAISEFAVVKSPNGDVVTYKGFIDEKNVISYYNSYEYMASLSALTYSGYLICGVTNGDTAKAVCSLRGFDKYTTNASVDYNEFLKIEKEILTKAETIFCFKLIPESKSTASGHLKDKKSEGQSYANVLKQLG